MQKQRIKWNYNGAIMAARSTVIFKMSYIHINFFLLLFYVSIAVLLNSCSTIYSAAQDGNLEKVKNFVEKGKNINDPKNFSGTTPLSAAANHGHLEVVKYLVSNGADVNMQKNGFILSYSNKIAVDNYKYKISMKSNGGTNPLTAALIGYNDWDGVIKYLLEKGAKTNFTYISVDAEPVFYDNRNQATFGEGSGNFQPSKEEIDTPLTRATKFYGKCQKNGWSQQMLKFKSVIEYMIKFGADKTLVDGQGDTAYKIAVQNGSSDLFDILKP